MHQTIITLSFLNDQVCIKIFQRHGVYKFCARMNRYENFSYKYKIRKNIEFHEKWTHPTPTIISLNNWTMRSMTIKVPYGILFPLISKSVLLYSTNIFTHVEKLTHSNHNYQTYIPLIYLLDQKCVTGIPARQDYH